MARLRRRHDRLRQMILFAIFGVIMFISKMLMEALPNIHLLGMFIIAFTLVYRVKALIPIYIYVLLDGLIHGFSAWWIPYLYIWAILWAATMLMPRKAPLWLKSVLCPALCCLHGICFGMLYAPVQAIMFGMDTREMLTWIAAGFSFDLIHAIGNLAVGLLALPLAQLLEKLERKSRNSLL